MRVATFVVFACFFWGCESSQERAADAAADTGNVDVSDGATADSPAADSLNDSDQKEDAGVDASEPGNSCANPTPLNLTADTLSVQGSTDGLVNEFGEQIVCDYCDALGGPQIYYSIALQENKYYAMTLQPSFRAQLYLFADGSCSPAAINAGCGAGSEFPAVAAGIRASFWPGNSKKVHFRPESSGQYLLVVDSTAATEAGPFQLDIEAKPAPFEPGECTGDLCGIPCSSGPNMSVCDSLSQELMPVPAVALVDGKATVTGQTMNQCGFDNQFGEAISCGTDASLVGVQRYYKIELTGGQSYTFSGTAQFTMGYFYIFGETCDSAQIEADCSSSGATGVVSAELDAGTEGTVSFTPPSTGTYYFAFDSACGSELGPYEIKIEAQ